MTVKIYKAKVGKSFTNQRLHSIIGTIKGKYFGGILY